MEGLTRALKVEYQSHAPAEHWLEVVQVVSLKVEIWTLKTHPKVRICFLFLWSKPSAITMFKKNGNRQCTKNEQNARTLAWQTLHISKLPLALLRSKVGNAWDSPHWGDQKAAAQLPFNESLCADSAG